jgi:4-diphosphocytidyl-2-C-methyl-D-erythritol kinase
MITITEQAPAKINLTLEVLGRRADGYHELVSLIAFAREVFDVIELLPAPTRTLTVQGPCAGSIVGDNILMRAMALLEQAHLQVGAVSLEKHLPIASGIGGGSADAGALLRAVRSACSPDSGRWHEIAASLGADVPICLANAPAWVRGAGAEVEPVVAFPTLHAVLANPLVAVPPDKTAKVFRALGLATGERAAEGYVRQEIPKLSSAGDVIACVAAKDNGLTEPARRLVPAIADVLADLSNLDGCRVARMSGAGPTCFGLFEDATAAHAAAVRLQAVRPGWWVRASRLA